MPEKRGVKFHLLAYYSFRWQCMQLFPQSLRGPFLLLVIITLLLFAHEAEYSCRGPTKKMQHTKTSSCICVHIHFFFFWGNQGSIYLRLAEGTPTYSTWQGEEKHIGVKCIGNQWGIPPNTRAHFSSASINHFTEVFLLLQFPGNAYLMEYSFACEAQSELPA